MQTVSSKRSIKTIDLIYCALFATLIMIGANITTFVPFLMIGGVPITLQSFFAILAGLILGSKKGALACSVYLFIGLAGAPVFSKFTGGFSAILFPTFGFIVSFIISAYIAGKIVEHFKVKMAYFFAAFIAMAINYAFGTTWLFFAYKFWVGAPEGFNYTMAWLWMLPPLPKDIILALFAGYFAYRIQKILKFIPIQRSL